MKTPAAPAPGALRPIYGERVDSINRRAVIGTLAALAIPAPALARRKAITRLWWEGRAHVEAGGRVLDLTVQTELTVPLIAVRSRSYIVADGPQSARTLDLEPDGVWVERGGVRSALPAQLGVHERMQYAMYAWLLSVQQAKAARRQAEAARGRTLRLSSLPWPDIVFEVGPDGFPVAAEWTVEDAEPGKPPIAQRVTFSGRIDDNGVRWPRRFDLTQRGRPYFRLEIDRFRAR